jgi:hypothetical protein
MRPAEAVGLQPKAASTRRPWVGVHQGGPRSGRPRLDAHGVAHGRHEGTRSPWRPGRPLDDPTAAIDRFVAALCDLRATCVRSGRRRGPGELRRASPSVGNGFRIPSWPKPAGCIRGRGSTPTSRPTTLLTQQQRERRQRRRLGDSRVDEHAPRAGAFDSQSTGKSSRIRSRP